MESKKDYLPIQRRLNIIPAEDDINDLLLFEEAVDELPVFVQLNTFNNGDELMEWLNRDQKNTGTGFAFKK
ncbi:hypothetical protein BH23BAC3_BH23BAC3_34860 [soil metagenome]